MAAKIPSLAIMQILASGWEFLSADAQAARWAAMFNGSEVTAAMAEEWRTALRDSVKFARAYVNGEDKPPRIIVESGGERPFASLLGDEGDAENANDGSSTMLEEHTVRVRLLSKNPLTLDAMYIATKTVLLDAKQWMTDRGYSGGPFWSNGTDAQPATDWKTELLGVHMRVQTWTVQAKAVYDRVLTEEVDGVPRYISIADVGDIGRWGEPGATRPVGIDD